MENVEGLTPQDESTPAVCKEKARLTAENCLPDCGCWLDRSESRWADRQEEQTMNSQAGEEAAVHR